MWHVAQSESVRLADLCEKIMSLDATRCDFRNSGDGLSKVTSAASHKKPPAELVKRNEVMDEAKASFSSTG